ncbi:PTS sugar transporter subunit IIA, partial [Escherichia coli]|uniref:PTS sugar transporter subunit IIA n=1 Tax=Escherichia coli TaxID=562 RepID=UPI0024472C65
MTNLFVRSRISFVDRSEVLTHIGNEMLAKGVVHDTWPQALIAREAEFPTGIMLEQHAIAIPHCEAIHAKEGANKRGNSSRLTQSFHFFMFEPIFSPVNALNQPI